MSPFALLMQTRTVSSVVTQVRTHPYATLEKAAKEKMSAKPALMRRLLNMTERLGRQAPSYEGDAQPLAGVGREAYPTRTTGSLVLAGSRADRPFPVFLGLFGRVLLRPKDDLPVLRVHDDRVAFGELAHQHLLRERVDD